jgi:sortase A
MGVTPDGTNNTSGNPAPLAGAGQALAAFYDRRAPAALAYCARLCPPESIADAVEDAFGRVFAAATDGEPLDEDSLERRLRSAVRAAAAQRSPGATERRFVEAERAYDALAGDDAPALGRSLLAEMIEAEEPAGVRPQRPAERWFDTGEFEWNPAAPVIPVPADALARRDPAVTSADTVDFSPVSRRRRLHLPSVAPGWRRRVAIVMLVMGTLLLAEAIVTVAWKEPFTGYLAAQAQDDLSKDLEKLDKDRTALGARDQRSLAAIRDSAARTRRRMALLAARLDGNVAEGEALGRIQIDRLDADYVFVQGTGGDSLRKGPGHYHPDTQLPGEGGTVGIAGHRTTYEAPFRHVDDLKAGDKISVRMPYGLFTYEVTGHRIVPADYRAAFAHVPGTGETLVLSACHPLYSATERILVEAKLVASRPLGAAVETAAPATPPASAKILARRRTAARLKLLGDRQLGSGMTGPDVRELQRLLGMPVTGTFDANTTAAVTAFQTAHGLPPVGRAGSQTKRALARQPHLPSRPPTPAAVPQQQSTTPNATGRPQQSGTTGQYQQPTTPYQPPGGTQAPQGTGRTGATGNGQ